MGYKMPVWLCLLALWMFALQSGPPAPPNLCSKTFRSADGIFQFKYPASYQLTMGDPPAEVVRSMFPVCKGPLACVLYPRSEYAGTNFQAAGFQVREVSQAKTREACLDVPAADVPTSAIPKSEQKRMIGRFVFTHGRSGDVGMGNFLESDFYRVFHIHRCYELGVNIATSAFVNFEPGSIKEFTDQQRVQSRLVTIVDSFRFLK